MSALAGATTRVPSPLSWLRDLAGRGESTAVVTSEGSLSYADLAGRVEAVADALAGTRRLVLVEGANRIESLVGYLGALSGGHVVLLVPTDNDSARSALQAAYDPDAVVAADGAVEVLREGSGHDLHPDLALLLSTSGSTGSPKLVRLSWENVESNADQIAAYLDIRESDRAATTLPLHYCYGLSVVHSHLSRGASLALTDLSVVDECFWEFFRASGATAFAGVPYTFDLLDRVGFESMDLPRLRYVTQAGGRLDADRVRHWASVGRARGWDLFVMYGQTEATARMAYLPPDLAVEHPASIGVPVPGGSFEVVDGELHYSGPNVMLGYAESPADLALGRTVDRLRTGDLGHETEAGLLVVTGRSSRFTKVLGHRIDLDRVEAGLRAGGQDARCAGQEGVLVVAVRPTATSGVDLGAVRRRAGQLSGAPLSAVRVVAVDDHAVLANGKTDYVAVLDLVAGCDGLRGCQGCAGSRGDDGGRPSGGGPAARSSQVSDGCETRRASGVATVADLYAVALARADVGPSSTFASLGGDSLSYVEVSIRLEELLGTLPPSWHVRPVGELEELAPSREERSVSAPSRRTPGGVLGRLWSERRTLETNVWLRALAIVLIVGTHADVFVLQGTAHALLVLVGYNVVRFALASDRRRDRLRSLGRGATRVVLPTLAVIVPAHLVWGHYQPRNLVLANWLLGEERLGPPWRFWFIEALVVALVVAMVLVALPAFARAERRWRFGLPVALTTVAFTARLELYPLPGPRMQGSALVVLFLFFLGWAIARATTRRQLWVVTVLTVAMAGTFSGNPARDLLTVGFVLLLIWKPVSRVPRAVVPTVQVLAASSLFVYVIHWQVLELLWGSPILAFLGSLAVGIGYWWLWSRVMPAAWRAARNTILRIVTDGHAPNSPNRPASQYLRSKLLQGQTSRKERRRCIAPFPIALPSWGRRPRSRSWPGARPLQ